MTKSKLLKVYLLENGSIALNATKGKGRGFVSKTPPQKYGKNLSKNISDNELGKWIRAILKKCDY